MDDIRQKLAESQAALAGDTAEPGRFPEPTKIPEPTPEPQSVEKARESLASVQAILADSMPIPTQTELFSDKMARENAGLPSTGIVSLPASGESVRLPETLQEALPQAAANPATLPSTEEMFRLKMATENKGLPGPLLAMAWAHVAMQPPRPIPVMAPVQQQAEPVVIPASNPFVMHGLTPDEAGTGEQGDWQPKQMQPMPGIMQEILSAISKPASLSGWSDLMGSRHHGPTGGNQRPMVSGAGLLAGGSDTGSAMMGRDRGNDELIKVNRDLIEEIKKLRESMDKHQGGPQQGPEQMKPQSTTMPGQKSTDKKDSGQPKAVAQGMMAIARMLARL